MSSEHRNRTNKAQAIAAALVVIGVTSDDVLWLPESTWAAAAVAGWHVASAEGVEGIAAQPWTTASKSTRTQVRAFLAADEKRKADEADGLTAHRVDDVFAQIAAPVVAVRPAPDPDRAPMHCTEYVEGDPDGCARCSECRDEHGSRGAGAPVVSTREWLAAHNYGAPVTESWN